MVIVGTGICGAFAAQELLSQSDDADVLVLEARTLCSGATGRNGGHLVPLVHEQRPGIIAWELRNFDHVQGLIKSANIPCDFRQLDSCLGFWNKTYFEEAKAALKEAAAFAPEQTRHGVRVVEDARELQQLNLGAGAVGALVQTTAASLSPYKLVTWLWQDLLSKYQGSGRLNLQTTTPVTWLSSHHEGGDGAVRYLITTERGTVSTNHVILATNGYTSHLLPQFTRLITPTQAQMTAQLPPADSAFSQIPIPHSYGFVGIPGMDREMADYLVQQPISGTDTGGGRGELMYGGGRHAAEGFGVGVSDDSHVDPGVEHYLRGLPERLNLATASSSSSLDDGTTTTASTTTTTTAVSSPVRCELLASWTGIIGSSIDGCPWVGGVPDHPGLFLAAGYSGHGMPNAPLSGRHVARLALESLKGGGAGDWQRLQRAEVELTERISLAVSDGGDDHRYGKDRNFGVPIEYVITKQRMEKALTGQ